MADKEILAVEIDDSAFSEFKKKFDEYEAALKAMPACWAAAGTEIAGTNRTSFEKAATDLVKAGSSASTLAKAAGDAGKIADAAGLTWVSLSKSGKLFAGNIVHATQHLAHWTKLTGIIGAGGLFGINRRAAGVAGQRTSAAGLGISYGEQASFLTNFGRLGNAEGILQGFSEAETDASKKYALRQYLGHTESGDSAKDFAEGLGRFKEFVDNTQPELLGNMLHARGYDKLGIGIEQAMIVRGMSREEVAQIGRDYQGDLAGRLGLADADAKKWTEFSTQMERAGYEIENVFAKGTIKLAKPLEHLSESFVRLTENLLKDGSPISGWIKDLGKGIQGFADKLGSGAFQAGAAKLGQDVADVVKLFDSIVAKAPSGLAVLLGTATAARFGGAATAIGGGLARSSTLSVLGRGAGIVLGPAGVLAAGGLAVSSSSTNEGITERERQRRFHQGAFAPEHMKQRPIFGHPHGISKPGSAATGAAPEGTPWNHEFHPRRYQGKMKIGNESFDFASGSPDRGRGSSPFGDHPITGFDPSAMHGRGGGAFRTTDVFDPQTGDKRGAVEIHMSNQEDIRRVETAGCFGIPRQEWQGAKNSLKKFMGEHGGATLRVYPNGNAEVVPRRSPLASYASARSSFGHPHGMGHHPATVSRAEKGLVVEDHTGGLVTVVPH